MMKNTHVRGLKCTMILIKKIKMLFVWFMLPLEQIYMQICISFCTGVKEVANKLEINYFVDNP